MKYANSYIWTTWVFLCFLLVYIIACFIEWEFVSFQSMGSAGRGSFIALGGILMGITFWIPGIITDKITKEQRMRGR